jgi:hypothetical protein
VRALALIALVVVPSATAAAPARVIDSVSVGGYRITQSRSRAIDVFGAPTFSVHRHNLNLPQGQNTYCRTHWRSLELTLSNFGECSLPGRTWRITVEGNGWRTREGLRVGDRASRITQLYRGARRTAGPDAAATRWFVTPLGVEWDLRRARPSSAVIVATQSGRVVGFELRRL